MIKESLEFRAGEYGQVEMWLNMPDAMEILPITKIRKFLKDVMGDRPDLNEEACKKFFAYVPEIIQARKEDWDNASIRYQKEYRDPNRGVTRKDKKYIKWQNDRLLLEVRGAKNKYMRFVNKAEKLHELKEKYCRG